MEVFLGWLARHGIDDATAARYRRCVEWILHCTGREDFDEADIERAVVRAADDPSAARQVDAIRQAGLTWIRWRGDCAVRAPTELPDRAWIERLRATLSARPEVRGAYLAEMFMGAEEPRHLVWIDFADSTPEPGQVLAEIGARLPTCQLGDRMLGLRGADAGPLSDLVRRTGLALYERPVTAATGRTPPIDQDEKVEGTLSKRYTLQLMLGIDGSIPTHECLAACERRIAAWKRERGARAKVVMIGFVVPLRLHPVVGREIENTTQGRWATLLAGLQLQLALYDERGEHHETF